MKVIRMKGKFFYGQKPFTWVHLANRANKPLCGKIYDPKNFEPLYEEIDNLDDVEVCAACWAAKKHFKVETLQAGQRRPYADSIYEYRIVDLAETKRDRDFILTLCQRIQKSYPCDEMEHPFVAEFCGLEDKGDGVWVYEVRERYAG